MSDLSQLPDADRERLVKGRFAELFQENASDPNFISALAKAVAEQLKSNAPPPSPRPPQEPTPSSSNGGGRVSAFEKYLLGR